VQPLGLAFCTTLSHQHPDKQKTAYGTMGKQLVPTNKIKVIDNLNDTGVSI